MTVTLEFELLQRQVSKLKCFENVTTFIPVFGYMEINLQTELLPPYSCTGSFFCDIMHTHQSNKSN